MSSHWATILAELFGSRSSSIAFAWRFFLKKQSFSVWFLRPQTMHLLSCVFFVELPLLVLRLTKRTYILKNFLFSSCKVVITPWKVGLGSTYSAVMILWYSKSWRLLRRTTTASSSYTRAWIPASYIIMLLILFIWVANLVLSNAIREKIWIFSAIFLFLTCVPNKVSNSSHACAELANPAMTASLRPRAIFAKAFLSLFIHCASLSLVFGLTLVFMTKP